MVLQKAVERGMAGVAWVAGGGGGPMGPLSGIGECMRGRLPGTTPGPLAPSAGSWVAQLPLQQHPQPAIAGACSP